jgi:integrase
VAGISNDPGGRRRILFVAGDGTRKTLRLGKVSQRVAAEIKTKVEHLTAAASAGVSIDGETARWLAAIGDDLHRKLAAAGLVAPRRAAVAADVSLAQWLKDYREHRADVSGATQASYGVISKRLLAFFPADQPLHAITEGDADRWLVWLKQKYAGPTVSKSVKVARLFWSQAVRDGLAVINPFAHLRTPSEVNTARAFFVDQATFELVLAACPDHEWRLLLALARYGGLRTPSEPLALAWEDVNWERERFRVVAPKTEHHDGGERWVPLFPELLPHLEEAFERAAPGTAHVITRWRDAAQNLRTGLLRILRRAGVKPWPRLYQNLRSSRETELAERFPIHVVAEWLGNSPKTALAHYTQVTEDHYRRAAASEAAQNPAQQAAASGRTGTQPLGSGSGQGEPVQALAIPRKTVQGEPVARAGLEPARLVGTAF